MTEKKACPKCGADLPVEADKPKKSNGYIRTISGEFLNQTLYFYLHSIQLQKEEPTGKGINRRTSFAIPAYILAAAGMETFINEVFLSEMATFNFPDSPLWELPKPELDQIERLEFPAKLALVPRLVAGKTIQKDDASYRDAITLYKIRNALVHFKYKFDDSAIEKKVDELTSRGIAFEHFDGFSVPEVISTVTEDPLILYASTWLDRISTIKGIAWAYNVSKKMTYNLAQLLPERAKTAVRSYLVEQSISDERIAKDFKSMGVPID